MTPFLAQLEEQLRSAAEREVASGRRRPRIVARRRLWSTIRIAPVFAAVGLAAAVFVVAVVSLHHEQSRSQPVAPAVPTPPGAALPVGAPTGPSRPVKDPAQGGVVPGTLKVVAETRDLHGGLPWGLETFRTTGGQTCLLAGREQSGSVGVIGQDGTFHNDSRFHPFTPYAGSGLCGQTDGAGNAFVVVSEPTIPASGNSPYFGLALRGCRATAALARGARSVVCPADDDRQLEYGLLGPDATSVTYTAGGRAATVATGPGGAFIVIGRPIKAKYGGAVSSRLHPGLVTAVSYRDGSTCRPHNVQSGSHQSSGCPLVGYLPPRVPRVTSAEVRAPVTASVITAKRWCGNHSGHYVACDAKVPPGYRVLPHASGMVLLQWSWIARVAASGPNTGYEYAIKDGPPCGGGQSSSGPIHARRGQRVVQQSLGSSACAQRDTIGVEYRTNVGPGGTSFATPPNPGHDGQPFVGSTSVYVPR